MTLTKAQTAAVCLLLGAGPVAYQWHAVGAARAEREHLRLQWGAGQEKLSAVEAENQRTERRLRAARETTAGLEAALHRRQAGDKVAAHGPGAPLYRWSEQSDYVRVPKSLLNKLTLADESDAEEERGGRLGKPRPVLREDGSVAGLLVEALDLGTNQAAAVHESLAAFSRDFAALAQQHSEFIKTPPGTHGFQGASKTLATQRFPEEGAALEQRLRQELQEAIGPERTALLWGQAKADFLYWFNNFGRARKETTVVRDADSHPPAFWVVRVVGKIGDERDMGSAFFKADELPPNLRSWWPDVFTGNSNANGQ